MKKTRAVSQARAALVWGAAWFVLLQLAAAGFLEWKQPEFYDPKYGCRLRQLRARLSHDRGSALWVVLGTSRAEQGLRPGLLPVSPGRTEPLVFNLARGGSSPLLNLLTLQRLLADGIHPDGVLLEIFPPSLVREKSGVTIAKITLRDLPLLRRYRVSWQTYARSVRDRLLLWSRYRSRVLAYCAPAWLSHRACLPERMWDSRGGEWLAIGEGVTARERRDLTADARRRYFRKLQDFRITSAADRAFRELLDRCRAHGIRVVLFIMPEANEFHSWYAPRALELLTAYLASLQREYGIPLIDARQWIPDADFCDGHHLLRNGAAAFTQQLSAGVLRRLVSPGQESGALNLGSSFQGERSHRGSWPPGQQPPRVMYSISK